MAKVKQKKRKKGFTLYGYRILFRVSGPHACAEIGTTADWHDLVAANRDGKVVDLYCARIDPSSISQIPTFGFGNGYAGDTTLGEFIETLRMKI